LAVEPSLAAPVFPESAAPLALPDFPDPLPDPGCPLPQGLPDPWDEPDWTDPLCGSAVADPLFPEPFSEVLPAVAAPVDPVSPDTVLPMVLASPDWAVEPELDWVSTAPDWPPLPELPETAMGLEVARPVSVEPVEPVDPVMARTGWPQEPWPQEP
jgi:hypothetical protein